MTINQPIRKRLLSGATGTLHHSAARFMLAILLTMLTTLTAHATDFITDVMVIGTRTSGELSSMKYYYQNKGWTVVDNDLNAGAGGDYIYLLYKTTSSNGSSGTPITGFYISDATGTVPDELDYGGHTYYLASFDGDDQQTYVSGSGNFKATKGDLNSGTNGVSTHLYYTREQLVFNPLVTGISFNGTQIGAVVWNGNGEAADLNKGCGTGTDYIYMHVTAESMLVTLDSETGEVTLQDGNGLTGTGGANTHVTIADGATVTLSGVDITGISTDQSHQWAGITCLGDAVIILDEGTTNDVKGGLGVPVSSCPKARPSPYKAAARSISWEIAATASRAATTSA